MLDAALDLGVIQRKGSWYAYGDDNLAQGRLKTLEYLKANQDLRATIEGEVRQALADFGREDDVGDLDELIDSTTDEVGAPEMDVGMEASVGGTPEEIAEGFE